MRKSGPTKKYAFAVSIPTNLCPALRTLKRREERKCIYELLDQMSQFLYTRYLNQMKITIVGGGNIGTQFAVHCAEKGNTVIVYTSTPELYNGHLSIVDDEGVTTHEGTIDFATSDPHEAFKDADLIFVTLPSYLMKDIAEVIYSNTGACSIIGVVPGNGGGECAFKKCIERGNVFFGIERVPAIARLVEKGKTVKSTGYRNELHVAALPKKNGEKCAKIVESIFDMPTKVIPNYLNLTMTPSNPILHTTRLKTIFGDWHEGISYNHLPLFYEDWDDASSALLIECDREVQDVCLALPEFELQYVKSLRDHYESPTIHAMTQKISSIKAFKGLKTPAIEKNGYLIPDLLSRYFTADFSYGLCIIKQVASFAKVNTPNIDELLKWYEKISVKKDEFRYEDYGITDRDTFNAFYLQ